MQISLTMLATCGLSFEEGQPPENPASVFKVPGLLDMSLSGHRSLSSLAYSAAQVPFRLQGLRGVLQSEWDQQAFQVETCLRCVLEAFLFPIASTMKNRHGFHMISNMISIDFL